MYGKLRFLILNNNSSTSRLWQCPVLISYSNNSRRKLINSVSKLSLYSNSFKCLNTRLINEPSEPKLKDPTDSSTERIKLSRSTLETRTCFKM